MNNTNFCLGMTTYADVVQLIFCVDSLRQQFFSAAALAVLLLKMLSVICVYIYKYKARVTE
jgi:hypothetical protein